ncbi:MAG: site-2 protease family protein [Candidatus Methylomirabilia bacterium]
MSDLFGSPLAFLQALILKIPALLIAVTVHEVAHGVVADRLGDPTARLQGRLTLNPLPHIDPIGAIAFVLAGFGWAKPVPVNAANLRRPIRDMAMVAGAGPATNLITAFASLLLFHFWIASAVQWPIFTVPLFEFLQWTYRYNLVLAIFNLLPLPPLDGGHFLPYLLPRQSWARLQQFKQIAPFVLILLVMSGVVGQVLGPVVRFVNAVFHLIVSPLF